MDTGPASAAIFDWLIANGIKPSDVPRDSSLIIHLGSLGEPPSLEYEQLVRDEAGLLVGETVNNAFRERRWVRLKTMPALPVAE